MNTGVLGESCEGRERDRTCMRSLVTAAFRAREALSANWSGRSKARRASAQNLATKMIPSERSLRQGPLSFEKQGQTAE